MRTELRKLVALILLRWAFIVMPDCKFKIELAKLLSREEEY